ncbi:hypothetical protein B484DRAFT_414596 [Ochromonadaceae sp. CCMP2298]|nr:hypothetical protein B484DRAFT_414596 [Ochromonadaceae sp. CCMP2298]
MGCAMLLVLLFLSLASSSSARKAAGSSLRTTLHEAADRMKFYYPETFRARCFSNLTAVELRTFLVDDVDAYGFSALNEPFRILSGVTDEDLLERAGFVELEGGVFTPTLLRNTLRNAARCTNILLEVDRDTTSQMLQTRLPDLYDADAFKERHENEFKSECDPPRADQVAMLESVSALEGVEYHAVHEFVTNTFGIPENTRRRHT